MGITVITTRKTRGKLARDWATMLVLAVGVVLVIPAFLVWCAAAWIQFGNAFARMSLGVAWREFWRA